MPASLPSPVAKPQLDRLEGLVERVTFHNADNGFCVLRLKVKGERELITLIGHAPTVAPGEYAAASESWVTDREHGRQFKAVFVKISPPNTLTASRYTQVTHLPFEGPELLMRHPQCVEGRSREFLHPVRHRTCDQGSRLTMRSAGSFG